MNRYINLIFSTSVMLIFLHSSYSQRPYESNVQLSGAQLAGNEYSVRTTDSLIQCIIDQTNLDTLIHWVNILSGEDSVTINDNTYLLLSRNAIHTHNNLAADFIFQTLYRFGLTTYNQNYSSTGRNVYGIQTGTDFPDQKFIICAHYDDMPISPPAPGADDNASGTAAVLEAARILSQIPTPYTIIFALWDEEEIGLFGSSYFSQQAFQSGEDILGVINLDMLGWDGNNDGMIDIHTNSISNSLALANLIYSLEDYYTIGLTPVIYNPGSTQSDHASFWNQGYSAVFLIEAYYGSDFNPFLHTSDDRIIHFNLNYFHAQSKLAVAAIAHLAFYNINPVDLETGQNIYLSDFKLHQNYPNPFNPTTVISWQLTVGSLVKLSIYDLLGKEVAVLVNEKQAAGFHQTEFDASGMASGIYIYRLITEGFVQTRKMVLMR